jgi:amino acid permease
METQPLDDRLVPELLPAYRASLSRGGVEQGDAVGVYAERAREGIMQENQRTEHVGSQPELKRVMGPGLLLLFIVGDILGTGIYALTGQVAAEVGGVVWLPFLVAFIVALMTAFSYLELVTKYPRAAGAALYTHKAFGIHFVTFLVAFAVMSSGVTSAATASRAFAANFLPPPPVSMPARSA